MNIPSSPLQGGFTFQQPHRGFKLNHVQKSLPFGEVWETESQAIVDEQVEKDES